MLICDKKKKKESLYKNREEEKIIRQYKFFFCLKSVNQAKENKNVFFYKYIFQTLKENRSII